METWVPPILAIAYELSLFAAVVFALFGVDDLLVDALALAGVGRGAHVALPDQLTPNVNFAIFIPAWREGDVIGAMLNHALAQWRGIACTLYVGVYPNDLATMLAVAGAARQDPRVRMVLNDEDGPTTKGACLNRLWFELCADLAAGRSRATAVLLHDAEDVVDSAELAVLGQALVQHAYAQIPVIPLMGRKGKWVGRHYCDEFAEAHAKELPVRAGLGAPMPTAGVGCAFRVDALTALARGSGPFCADSLAEDYELGLQLSARGASGQFVIARHANGELVASRGYFPHALGDAVQQKTRWLRGIALDGWDRIGWITNPRGSVRQDVAAIWMLWRDRRAIVAAAAICAAYLAMMLAGIGIALAHYHALPVVIGGAALGWLCVFNMLLFGWRLVMRSVFTARIYGWRQGLMAIARQPVSNFILVLTARRALTDYVRGLRGASLRWDKTTHQFPVPHDTPIHGRTMP